MENKVKTKIEEVRKLIESAGTGIFSVTFVKRSNGETRKMLCRLNVTKGLKDKDHPKPAYDPKNYDLYWVFDIQKEAYRSVPLDAVTELKIKGKVYKYD